MPRAARVLSFMSHWGPPPNDHHHHNNNNNNISNHHHPSQPNSPSPTSGTAVIDEKAGAADVVERAVDSPPPASFSPQAQARAEAAASPTPDSPVRGGHYRSTSQSSSRPLSMIQTMSPTLMEVSQDTLPELQRIFSFLNAHSTKLYQEGYFLKLHDLDTRGRPSNDRVWTECFAQLVGTQLSLWDAQSLDAAGEHGEVVPTFINLADASIKMIENLPMNSPGAQALQNVLSISTAANNRYLLHFNSLNSLTQWTAGIRLAMFEHASLQEAYTGSIIAGKGRHLNNIRAIMNRTTFKVEDWARVRFGAGTPWRRCWYVIEPPDEKEYQKAQKAVKKNPYEKAPRVKGCIRFYDSNKIKKKTNPIATITDAYSAYAVYPVTRQLIDQSTLLKIDGQITIHGKHDVETEGFVFVMPEMHAMVPGFEMLLRFLFPAWDVFNLYGRPTKLIADPIDSKGLMFALPTDRRYGYLEILDVAGLIHTKGSSQWSEYRWRKEMRAITSSRMDINLEDRPSTRSSDVGGRKKKLSRNSLPGSRNGVRFGDETPPQSEPNSNRGSPGPRASFDHPPRAETAPLSLPGHRRSLSERLSSLRGHHSRDNSRTELQSMSAESLNRGPQPPPHRELMGAALANPSRDYVSSGSAPGSGKQSPDSFEGAGNPIPEVEALSVKTPPPAPVAAPPAFAHGSQKMPAFRPPQAGPARTQGPIDDATLNQLADINRNGDVHYANYASAGASAAWNSQSSGEHYRNGSSDSLNNPDRLSAPDQQQRQLSASPRYRQPKSNLPTIPASPFVDQMAEPSPKASYFEPAGPPVPEHGESPGSRSITPQPGAGASRPDLPRAGSSMSIRRKPVGGQSAGTHLAPDNASIGNNPHDGYGHPLGSTRSVSPDWASVKSSQSQGSVNRVSIERPRAGVKRTVGTPTAPAAPKDVVIGETHYGVAAGATGTPTVGGTKAVAAGESLLDIDFGPTYALTTGTPTDTSSGNAKPLSRERGGKANASVAAQTRSPANNTTTSGDYFARSQHETDDANPSAPAGPLAWRPGLVPQAAQQSPRPALTPQEWVQQRAAIASQPMAPPPQAHARNKSSQELLKHNRSASGTPPPYAHARNKSSLEVLKHNRSASGTPPLLHSKPGTPSPVTTPGASRNSSADWTHVSQLQHQRTPSRELLQQGSNSRPGSRQRTSYTTIMTPGVDMNKLTGKEREYLARSTGTPLLSGMPGNVRPAPPAEQQPVGLVGAIAQRELEKRHVRDMSRSTAVQQALVSQNVQRQQAEAAHQRYSTIINPQMYPPQWQPQQQQQATQQQSAYAGSMYGLPTSVTPPLQSYPTQQQSIQDLQQAARTKIRLEEEERQQRMLSGRQSVMGMPGTPGGSTYGQYWPGTTQGHQRGPTWG